MGNGTAHLSVTGKQVQLPNQTEHVQKQSTVAVKIH